MENLYWKFHGIFEDIYYYVTALPRFILYWGEKSHLTFTRLLNGTLKSIQTKTHFYSKKKFLLGNKLQTRSIVTLE